MNENEKRLNSKMISQTDVMDYQAFLKENQRKVNLILNKFLRFAVLTGPLLMLLIRLGIFHSVTYTSCITITVLFLLLSMIHYALIRGERNYTLAAVVAFLAIDMLLILMNSAHIGIYITWFSVPFISLLFCDFKIYAIAVVVNYIMMTLSVWLVSPYYAGLRLDFASAVQYFSVRMGGYTIETLIMVVAGYSLCSLSTSYYRELIEKYRILSENKRQMNEQMAILESMSEIYEYASLIDLDDMTETSIRSAEAKDQHVSRQIGDRSRVNQELMPSVLEEQREVFRKFTDLAGAAAELHDQKSIDREFRSTKSGWFRAQYIVVERRADGTPKSVIYTVQSIDKQKQKEEHLLRISMTDELTGLYNRRRYDADIAQLVEKGMEGDFVLFSADVNGLKEVNDTLGHTAGDELLAAAGECLSLAIGSAGKVYRTGGDEFLAIANTADPAAILEQIDRLSAARQGPHGQKMSLSVGYGAHAEHPDADVHGLEAIADHMMYQKKNQYYSTPGIDRRRNTLP